MLRVIHTSDWHLGHTLHGWLRDDEHAAFLAWLLDRIEQHDVDALLVAGDVFETANPPAEAFRQLYAFVGELRRRCPHTQVVIVGGNHDSAPRLDSHAPIFAPLGVTVVGGLPRREDGRIDAGACCVALRSREGIEAIVAAVPYLRASDVSRAVPRGLAEGVDPLIAGVRAIYDEVLGAARDRRAPGQALLATGHCYMTNTKLSELSERRILGGNQHALPVDIFGDDVDYVALGHLHLAQSVERSERVRYSGSPIPLSMAESGYEHRVVMLDFEDGDMVRSVDLHVPRHVDLLRVPEHGPGSLDEVVTALSGVGSVATTELEPDRWPYLEVRVRLDAPDPGLRGRIEALVASRAVRLLRIAVEYTGVGGTFADFGSRRPLSEIQPERVFVDRWERRFGHAPDEVVRAAFAELLEQIHERDGAPSAPGRTGGA